MKLGTPLQDCVRESLTEMKWELKSGAQTERALGMDWKYMVEGVMLLGTDFLKAILANAQRAKRCLRVEKAPSPLRTPMHPEESVCRSM